MLLLNAASWLVQSISCVPFPPKCVWQMSEGSGQSKHAAIRPTASFAILIDEQMEEAERECDSQSYSTTNQLAQLLIVQTSCSIISLKTKADETGKKKKKKQLKLSLCFSLSESITDQLINNWKVASDFWSVAHWLRPQAHQNCLASSFQPAAETWFFFIEYYW